MLRDAAVTEPTDDRSPLAIAHHWAARIITVALEMVVPGLLGYWLDQWLGLKGIFILVGFGAGLYRGMRHLLQMTRSESRRSPRSPSKESQRKRESPQP